MCTMLTWIPYFMVSNNIFRKKQKKNDKNDGTSRFLQSSLMSGVRDSWLLVIYVGTRPAAVLTCGLWKSPLHRMTVKNKQVRRSRMMFWPEASLSLDPTLQTTAPSLVFRGNKNMTFFYLFSADGQFPLLFSVTSTAHVLNLACVTSGSSFISLGSMSSSVKR